MSDPNTEAWAPFNSLCLNPAYTSWLSQEYLASIVIREDRKDGFWMSHTAAKMSDRMYRPGRAGDAMAVVTAFFAVCLLASLASLPVLQFDVLSARHLIRSHYPSAHSLRSLCLNWKSRKGGRVGGHGGRGSSHEKFDLIFVASFFLCCKSHLTVWGVSVGPGLSPSSSSPSSSSSLLLTPPSHPTQDHRGRLELRAGYTLLTPPVLAPAPYWLSSSFPAIALPFVVFLPSLTALGPSLALPSCFSLRPPSRLLRSPAAVISQCGPC